MYINEKSFECKIEDKYKIRSCIEQFIQLVYELTTDYRLEDIYFCGMARLEWNSVNYPCGKWQADSEVDEDTKRRWMLLSRKINFFEQDKSYSFLYENMDIAAGAEAVLNGSYIISFAADKIWESSELKGIFVELDENDGSIIESEKIVSNLTTAEQIKVCKILDVAIEKVAENYEEMWEQRERWFPNLVFSPSVEKDLKKLEISYIYQIWKKLRELDNYVRFHGGKRFDANLLNYATPETDKTLQMYAKEHTFYDEKGMAYLMSWHLRFTGIAGRIFFLPQYQGNKILIGYIGKKLKNASYTT